MKIKQNVLVEYFPKFSFTVLNNSWFVSRITCSKTADILYRIPNY